MTRLQIVMNVWTLRNLRPDTQGPRSLDPVEVFDRLAESGYVGLQVEEADPLAEYGLQTGVNMSAMERVISPADFRPLAARHKAMGFTQTTLHVGTGFDSEEDGKALIEALLEAESAENYPLIVETHRATITQDPKRTIDLAVLYPDLTFNADLSHWYTGCELPYGDLEDKFRRLQPIFDKVRYMHGRVADSSCMQVPVTDLNATPARHFREMWTRCFEGFLRTTQDRSICFAPELLPYRALIDGREVELNYARLERTLDGKFHEETDRWQQAAILVELATSCYGEAQRSLMTSTES